MSQTTCWEEYGFVTHLLISPGSLNRADFFSRSLHMFNSHGSIETPYCLHKSFRSSPFLIYRKSQIVFSQTQWCPEASGYSLGEGRSPRWVSCHRLGHNSTMWVLNSPKWTLQNSKAEKRTNAGAQTQCQPLQCSSAKGRKSKFRSAPLPSQKRGRVPTGVSQCALGNSWVNTSDKASRFC